MDDARAVNMFMKSLSSASEISCVGPEVLDKLSDRMSVEMHPSLFLSLQDPKAHLAVPTALPLIKETRQERSNSALIGELERNCNTVSKLIDLISIGNNAMAEYVEQTKHSLSLSTSAHSAAALETIGAILSTVPDSNINSTDSENGDVPMAQGSVGLQTDELSRLSPDLSAQLMTPTGARHPESSDAPLSRTVLQSKEIDENITRMAALNSLNSPNRTPEPTFIRQHSISLQSIASTGQATTRPLPIRDLPDEILMPTAIPHHASLLPALQTQHQNHEHPYPSPQKRPWTRDTTVTLDNLPLPSVNDYFSAIENCTELSIRKLAQEPSFPTDDGLLQRLQYEVLAIRRFMNLNVSARDAEISRLDKEIQSLKAANASFSVTRRTPPNNEEKCVKSDLVATVYSSPFSVATSADNPSSTAPPLVDIEPEDVNVSLSDDLTQFIITPAIIESCFSETTSVLPGVSSLSIKTSAPDASKSMEHSDSVDLIKEYTTANLTSLKAELARTREEAIHIIMQKDAEIAEMRRNLAATKSITSVPTSAGISMVSTLLDRPALTSTQADISLTDTNVGEKSSKVDTCNTPLPKASETDSFQISSVPMSSTAVLTSVTHPTFLPYESHASSVQTVIHSGELLQPHPQYSMTISLNSTSGVSQDQSISVTEDQSPTSSRLTTSKLEAPDFKLAISTGVKPGSIPPKPRGSSGFIMQTTSKGNNHEDDYLPSPSSSHSETADCHSKPLILTDTSCTPMSATPAQNMLGWSEPLILSSDVASPHVTFNLNGAPDTRSPPISWPRAQPYDSYDPIHTIGSTPSNSSYINDVDTGDQRDDEFLRLEHEVRATQSQLMRSLAGTYLSDTYKSGDFSGTVLDTFSISYAVIPPSSSL